VENTEEQLFDFFKKSGATDLQAKTMTRQMIKRAGQLSKEREVSEVEAMQQLLKLFLDSQ
jgi:hypothetical protein